MSNTTRLPALLLFSALSWGQGSPPTLREKAKPYLDRALAAGNAFVSVSSASGIPGLAPGSLATAFGTSLASQTATGTAPYGTSLGGVSVQVVDSAGTAQLARLLYVSPTQINYQVPPGAALGMATVNLVNGTGNVPSGTAQIQSVAPALFTANGNGQGVIAATAYRQLIPTTLATPVMMFQCPSGPGSCVSVPIDVGLDQPVTLTLYTTGLRSLNGNPAAVSIAINGQTFPARAIAASDDANAIAGVDEVTLGLPISLRGAGEVGISVNINGQASNSGTIRIQ